MSVDGGFPRAVTIPIPFSIPKQEIGDYVSFFVAQFLTDLGSANIHRRSISLKFLEPRLAVLQLEMFTTIRLTEDQRERFQDAKASLTSTTEEPKGSATPEDLDLLFINRPEPAQVEAPQVAIRNQDRPRKNSVLRNT